MKRILIILTVAAGIVGLAGCTAIATPATTPDVAPVATPSDTQEQAAAVTPSPAAEAAPETPEYTLAQKNAIRSAESYLSFTAFSRAGLIRQLTSEYGEGFDPADAEFAVAAIEAAGGVDWNEQAAKSAESYLEFTAFSRDGLYDQLTSEYGEQFTHEQAEYALAAVGY